MSDAKYVTLDELAAHVGVKISTVRQWVKRGFVPRETYIKAGNTYRFCLEDVVASLRREEPKGRYEAAVEKAADNLREMVDPDVALEGEVLPRSEVADMLSELDDDL